MVRKLGWAIGLSLLLFGGLVLFLTPGDDPGLDTPRPDLTSNVDSDEGSEDLGFDDAPADPTVSETPIDLGEGAAGLTGTVMLPDGGLAAGATVTLYTSKLPHDLEDEGAIPLYRLTRGAGFSGIGARFQDSGKYPFDPEIRRGLKQVVETTADAQGVYRFEGLPAGSYLVAAQAADSLRTPIPEVEHLGETVTTRDVQLLPSATLEGVVVGETGDAIEGAQVRLAGKLLPENNGGAERSISREELYLYLLNPVAARTISREDGTFTVRTLPELDYVVFVASAPWATVEMEHALPAVQPLIVTLLTGGALEVTVTDEGGTPLEGVEVSAHDRGAGSGAGFLRAPLTATTDKTGFARIDGLAEIAYRLTVEAPGWQTKQITDITVEGATVRAVDVELIPGSTITGIVRDDAGAPLAGAEVRAVPLANRAQARWGPRATVETDAEGQFTIDTLGDQDYTVRARLDGWLEAEEDATPDAGVPVELALERGPQVRGRIVDQAGAPLPRAQVEVPQGWRGAKTVSLDADGRFEFYSSDDDGFILRVRGRGYSEASVDVPEEGGDLGEIVLEEGVRIEGFVTTPDGEPLVGARVLASREDTTQTQRWRVARRNLTAFSDAEGRFSIEVDAPNALYTVSASVPQLLGSEPVEVALAGVAFTDLHLVVRWGASLTGQVTGPTNVPVDGAVVELRAQDGRRTRRQASVRTSGGGEYVLAGLEAGTYQIRVSAARHSGIRVSEIALGADESRRIDLRLGAEQRLVGVVFDERGTPIDLARIVVSEEGAARRTGKSDPNGEFVIDRLGRGKLRVTVEAEGFLRARVDEWLASDGPLEVQLEQAHVIEGFVSDQGTGEPIRNARVRVRDNSNPNNRRSSGQWTRSDAEGRFRVEGLAKGNYRVDFTAEAYVSFTVDEVSLPARPSEETLSVSLRAGTRVRGAVYSSLGNPLSGARVRGYRVAEDDNNQERRRRGRAAAQARSDEFGNFELVGLSEGRYDLVFSHDEHLEEVETITLSIDQPEPVVNVDLEKGGTISGRVYTASGAFQTAGNVFLVGPVTRRARIRDEGTYRFSGLPGGEYTVRFRAGRRGSSGPEIDGIVLPNRGERIIDLHLPPE